MVLPTEKEATGSRKPDRGGVYYYYPLSHKTTELLPVVLPSEEEDTGSRNLIEEGFIIITPCLR